MSLSQRLKAAEYDRRLAAGLPVDHLDRPSGGQTENVQVDVREAGAPVIDLTDAPWADVIEMGDVARSGSNRPPTGWARRRGAGRRNRWPRGRRWASAPGSSAPSAAARPRSIWSTRSATR